MKNTPPSAQTESDKQKKQLHAHHEAIRAKRTDLENRFYDTFGGEWSLTGTGAKQKVLKFIQAELASERTRLLSVESMKMEEISGYCYQSRGGCSCGHIARNQLRQSILSEMEK